MRSSLDNNIGIEAEKGQSNRMVVARWNGGEFSEGCYFRRSKATTRHHKNLIDSTVVIEVERHEMGMLVSREWRTIGCFAGKC